MDEDDAEAVVGVVVEVVVVEDERPLDADAAFHPDTVVLQRRQRQWTVRRASTNIITANSHRPTDTTQLDAAVRTDSATVCGSRNAPSASDSSY